MSAKTWIAVLLAALLLPFVALAVEPNPGVGSVRAGGTVTADHAVQAVMLDETDDDSGAAVERDDFSIVPEAGTLALCAAGMLGLLLAGSGSRTRGGSSKFRLPSLRQTRRPTSR